VRPITGKELCRSLEQAGWTLRRVKGSHHIFGKPGEWKIISVPVHGNQTIKPGLAARIARDAAIEW
jgi:predicted RNA binding protein YcfA (HicA-like mRNA interferase family)